MLVEFRTNASGVLFLDNDDDDDDDDDDEDDDDDKA